MRKRFCLGLYYIIWLLAFICGGIFAYMLYSEPHRVSHALMSPFSEMMRHYIFLVVALACVNLSLSSIMAFLDKETAEDFFLLIAEFFSLLLEFMVIIVLIVIIFRFHGDNVWQQLLQLVFGGVF